jgi:copper chaperone CopZ
MCGWGLVGKSVTRGSHPQLDPYWSSNAVEVSHHGANHSRGDKVTAKSGWPVTHKYLRVCYEDKVDGMNCGVCEKCVRTQLEFMAAGRLQDVRTFPARSLSAGIDRIAGLPEHLMYNYEELAEEIDDPTIRFSIAELLLRSPRWQRRENRKAMLRKIWKKIRFRY